MAEPTQWRRDCMCTCPFPAIPTTLPLPCMQNMCLCCNALSLAQHVTLHPDQITKPHRHDPPLKPRPRSLVCPAISSQSHSEPMHSRKHQVCESIPRRYFLHLPFLLGQDTQDPASSYKYLVIR